MSTEPFIGEIKLVGFNFAPRGYAFCNGQLLSIAQNTALFSLLGTTYGGDGVTTFGLPNLQSRVPVGFGQGPGLSPVQLGEVNGVENVTLIQTQMPLHVHGNGTLAVAIPAVSGGGNASSPAGNSLAASTTRDNLYSNATPNTTLAGSALTGNMADAGGSQPHENRQPYLGMNFVIALQGIFPSRN